jgi:hypothetical protein
MGKLSTSRPVRFIQGKKLPAANELRYGGPQSRYGHYGEDINLLFRVGIEPRFQLCAARLGTIIFYKRLKCVLILYS